MSRLTLRLVIAVLTFTVGVLAVAGWYVEGRAPDQVSISSANAPAGWQSADVGKLKLLLPADMKQREEHGIDTIDFKFGNVNTTLNIEYGTNQGDFSELTDHPNYREESVIVDGRAAKLRFCRNDDSKTDYGDAEHSYITAIYFRQPWDDSFSLNVWAKSKDAAGQQLAKQIILSTKFK